VRPVIAEEATTMRVLVAVGSRHGATREIGDEVAQVLARAGHTVDVVHPDEVTDVGAYGAVVLGSAVYAGRLLPSVRALVHRCAAGLGETSVWVFWSGPVGVPLRPQEEPGETERLLRLLRPRGRKVFAGRIAMDELGMAERALVRMLGVAPGDHRDFAEVQRWAGSIAEELAAERPSARPGVTAPVGEPGGAVRSAGRHAVASR
jgi:menaquinone-dependent protoporphyrinogen oxidase